MKFHQRVLNCISQRLSKETDLATLSRHLGQNCGCMVRRTVRHTKLRLVCVRLSSRHTSLNYSALLAGSRGSRTSIFFNPSAVLSLIGFVLQQCQGWATDYPEPGLGIIFQNTSFIRSSSRDAEIFGRQSKRCIVHPQRSFLRSIVEQLWLPTASYK